MNDSTLTYEKLVSAFTHLENPIYISLLLVVVVLSLIFIMRIYVYTPLEKRHLKERRKFELREAMLMVLFADLDPYPVIRINKEGKIIYMNVIAKREIGYKNLYDKPISKIIPQIDFPIEDYITNNKSVYLSHSIRFPVKKFDADSDSVYLSSVQEKFKYFTVLFKGISYLQMAQIYFQDISEKIRYEEKLSALNRQLKSLSSDLNNKIEEERNRIASELHDNIGQNLSLLKLKLQNYHRDIPFNSGQAVIFDNTIDFLGNIITELKSISSNLKPVIIDEMGLAPAIESLCRKVSNESSIKRSFNMLGFEERPEPDLEITIYRIVQEALNNIVKHSGAKEFSVQLVKRGKLIRLSISDDGKGFIHNNDAHLTGIGLINIRERAERHNGIFKIDTAPGSGTVLIIEFPTEV